MPSVRRCKLYPEQRRGGTYGRPDRPGEAAGAHRQRCVEIDGCLKGQNPAYRLTCRYGRPEHSAPGGRFSGQAAPETLLEPLEVALRQMAGRIFLGKVMNEQEVWTKPDLRFECLKLLLIPIVPDVLYVVVVLQQLSLIHI